MALKKLWLPVLVFLISFAATYPGVSILIDETHYLRQAAAFANGQIMVEEFHPVTQQVTYSLPSEYPPGTSFVAGIFMLFGGWGLAFWMPALSLAAAIFFTALLLRVCKLNPHYALILLIFPPALVMARVVSSDVVSAGVVALGWFLFWKGSHQKEKTRVYLWFAAGFVAGASILFRESNALLFAPLFAGAMLRMNVSWTFLLYGGLLGVSLRLMMAQLIFGDPFFARDPHYGFSLSAIADNSFVYLTALTVFVPGGLFFGLLYKGERRTEVVTTIVVFTLFYLAYDFSGESSGFLKSLVLGPRFYIPLLPVLAFATAHTVPRVLNWLIQTDFVRKLLLQVSVVAISFGVAFGNVIFNHWVSVQREIQEAIIQHVPQNAAVVYNKKSTMKFMSELQGYPSTIHYEFLSDGHIEEIQNLNIFIVFVQRRDSEYWMQSAENENSFIERVQVETILDKTFLDNYRLRIYKTGEENS
ncbi:MAG: hypothetical protein EA391_05215 [Balneolaceae bacterium]|nr:MAG: hypothetical protein EA391_05215 [Balneolaceae bacterium]